MNTLGEKLKAARIEKKLSQIEVAEKLLVSRQTISKWENNVCLPDLDNFQKICELYGFSSSEVLNGESESTISEKQEELVEIEKEKQEMDSLLFLIPFFFLFIVIKKRKTIFQLSTKEKILPVSYTHLYMQVLFFFKKSEHSVQNRLSARAVR